MKKYLAILLAVAMLTAIFAGCGGAAGSAAASASAPAEEAASAAAPAEEAAEAAETAEAPAEEAAPAAFTWNGQKEVWSILPTTGAEGLVWINDSMGAVMEAQGFTYVKKDAQGDPGAQVQFVEQAIAAGNVGCLMIAAMSVEMLKDVVGQAVDAGIAVAYLGAQPTDYTIAGCVYTAYEITGMYAVQAAEYWAEHSGQNVPKNADGKYEIAIDTYYDIADGVYRSNAVKGTVEKSDILTLVSESTSYGDGALNTAFNNAQAVLNANPDCHIFVAYEPEEAMGINNAIMDYCEQTGNSPADYFVAPCYGEDTTFMGLYEEAAADPAANAIKGYSTYGDPAMPFEAVQEQLPLSYDALAKISEEINPGAPVIIPPILTGEHLAQILLGVCGVGGYEWEYGVTYYDTITAVTVDGFSATWSMGDENPAAEYKN